MGPDQYVEQLARWLAAEAGAALEAALATPTAAASLDWLAVLARHGVAAVGPDDRARTARITGQSQGAPTDELRGALLAMTRRCWEALDQTRRGLSDAGERRWDALHRELDRLPRELVELYQRQVTPAPRSMFAGALASAQGGIGAARDDRAAQPYIMMCRVCRGPRHDHAAIACVYCDTPFRSA